MIPKARRITTFLFSRFFRRCKKFRGKCIQISYYGTVAPSRFAVVVRKKDYKKAVDRNTIRRRIYRIIRHVGFLEKLSGGLFMVFFFGGEFSDQDIEKDLLDFLTYYTR